METIEIIIYFAFAVMVGALIIGFTMSINGVTLYDKVKLMFFGDDSAKFEKINRGELAMKAYNFWKECGYGQNDMELTVYINEDGNTSSINKEFLFKGLKKYNFCYTIQSEDNNCGSREDVVIPSNLDPPGLIRLKCETDGHVLNITQVS